MSSGIGYGTGRDHYVLEIMQSLVLVSSIEFESTNIQPRASTHANEMHSSYPNVRIGRLLFDSIMYSLLA